MATYCFICPACGLEFEATERMPTSHCDGVDPKRNFKKELNSQYVYLPVHMQSRVDVRASDVLPSAKDFEAPGDTDGSKGFAEWKKTVKPKHKSRWV